MRFGSHIRIIADHSWERYRVARSFESIAQAFCMNTTLIRATTEDELKRHGSAHSDEYQMTVLTCHGGPDEKQDIGLDWTVARHVKDTEWTHDTLRLTPATIGEYFAHGAGTLLCVACWSGTSELARAFLDAGYEAYIAPAKTSDCFSGLQFYAVLLGYLVYEERDYRPERLSIAACVQKARKIDDLWDGANGFAIFERDSPTGPETSPE